MTLANIPRCEICRRPVGMGRRSWCVRCCESYDRARRKDDGTIDAALTWAAKRAWRFALSAKRKT